MSRVDVEVQFEMWIQNSGWKNEKKFRTALACIPKSRYETNNKTYIDTQLVNNISEGIAYNRTVIKLARLMLSKLLRK